MEYGRKKNQTGIKKHLRLLSKISITDEQQDRNYKNIIQHIPQFLS